MRVEKEKDFTNKITDAAVYQSKSKADSERLIAEGKKKMLEKSKIEIKGGGDLQNLSVGSNQ